MMMIFHRRERANEGEFIFVSFVSFCARFFVLFLLRVPLWPIPAFSSIILALVAACRATAPPRTGKSCFRWARYRENIFEGHFLGDAV
jgi:hypothetical protein